VTEPGQNLILNIANLSKPKGLKGEVRCSAFGELLPSLEGESVPLYAASGASDGFLLDPSFMQSRKIVSVTDYGENSFLLSFEGIQNRTDAERLRGLHIGLPLSEARLRFHDPEHPYLFEYIGLSAKDEATGEIIGRVSRLYTDAMDWIYLDLKDKGEIMVPLSGPYIGSIVLDEGIVLVRDIEDLIEHAN